MRRLQYLGVSAFYLSSTTVVGNLACLYCLMSSIHCLKLSRYHSSSVVASNSLWKMSSTSMCHVPEVYCIGYSCFNSATLANSFCSFSIYYFISFSTNSLFFQWYSKIYLQQHISAQYVVILFVFNFGIAVRWLTDGIRWVPIIMWAYWPCTRSSFRQTALFRTPDRIPTL